jgi:hypothetical protein
MALGKQRHLNIEWRSLDQKYSQLIYVLLRLSFGLALVPIL